MKIIDEIKISENGFVFNSKTGDSFSLNTFGLEIIQQIQDNKDFDQIKIEMLEKYEVDELNFEKDFYEFCALLKHHQIISSENPTNFK